MIEAFFQALQNLGDVWILLFILAGTIWGLVFGLIPGLSGLVGMALFLPFVFGLPAERALPLMVAISAVQFIGGSITAILINIPGTSVNAATLIDGFPMTQKGEGGRALGAALASSGLGGIVSVFLALAMIPVVMFIIMGIVSPDMVFIIVMGLVFIGVLGRSSMVKGLISGGLGLLISFIGFQTVTGIARFSFGSAYLYDGIGLIPLALGIFAIPVIVDLAMGGGTIAQRRVVGIGAKEVWEGVKDIFRHWGLWLRATVIGYIIGVIPGVGGEVATFVAYGQAKQTSKHPERYGTGIVEGVIAPEAANNSKEGGAVLTTLALGIPGSATMVVLLGAFLMVGLIPGPLMLTEHLDLSFTLLLTIAVANLVGAVICLFIAPRLTRIATIPGHILVPIILSLVLVGSLAYRGLFLDIGMTLLVGVLGVAIKKFGFNAPALFLGYILGSLFEKYFFISLAAWGPLFFVRPVSLTLILIIVALLAFGPIKRVFNHLYTKRVKKI